MNAATLINFSPTAWLLLLGAVLACVPMALVWRRERRAWRADAARQPTLAADPARRFIRFGQRFLRALAILTLFLTFDLVVFGAFTRLTDSGLGCPDWPGCYGQASPLAAHADIHAAQTQLPTGPVTHHKAWIEMVHRYLATAVGALITIMCVGHCLVHRRLRQLHASMDGGKVVPLVDAGIGRGIAPGFAGWVLFWVCGQGLFGALTVTWKLYPAIVTLHLLGGIGLLALLTVQVSRFEAPRLSWVGESTAGLSRDMGSWWSLWSLRPWLAALLVAVIAQVALGGWVSTNYAVLACQDFPTCQGQWWPVADYRAGFTFRRELGRTGAGDYLPFAALTAIHWVHRMGAMMVAVLALWIVAMAARQAAGAAAPVALSLRRVQWGLLGMLGWQIVSGVSNAVLDWPLVSALAHTAGAAAWVTGLVWCLVNTRGRDLTVPTPSRIRHDADAFALSTSTPSLIPRSGAVRPF